MQTLRWWLRIVGVFYVLQFVPNAIVHAPISTVGPKDALALASAGDPLARFLVDTWVTFGLEIGAIGVALVARFAHTRAGESPGLDNHCHRIGPRDRE